jgi:hypothetical protein
VLTRLQRIALMTTLAAETERAGYLERARRAEEIPLLREAWTVTHDRGVLRVM